MSILGQAIMRILISAEVREATANLKALAATTKETSAEINAVAPAAEEATAGVDGLATAATTAKSALSGFGVGLALTAGIAAITALGVAFVDFVEHARAAKDANDEFTISIERLKEASDGVLDKLKEEAKLIQIIDEIENKSKPQQISDQIAATNREIQATVDAISKLKQVKLDIQNNSDLNLKQVDLQEAQAQAKINEKQVEQDKLINDLNRQSLELKLAQNQEEDKTLKSTESELSKRQAILQQIKQVQNELTKGSKDPLFKQEAASQPGGIDARVLEGKIAEAIQGGIKDPANKEAFAELANDLGKLLSKTLNPDLHVKIDPDLASQGSEIDKEVKKFFDDSGKTIDERMKRLPPLKAGTIKIDPEVEFSAEFLKKLDKLSNQINEILTSSIENAVSALGKAIGGGGLKSLFNDFLGIIGQGLEQLGKALIETYGVVKIAKEAIANAIYDPELVAVAGALAIVAGAAISKLANQKGISAFAEGGIVTGPTLGLIGEAGPEVVFPLEKLNQFIKGANSGTNMNVNGQFTVRGVDLVTVLNRTNKNQGLV